MTEQNTSKLNKLRKVFRINMLLGLVVSIIAVYYMITGTYVNIQAREATESLLGLVGIGGMLYLVGFWYMCVFRKHIFIKDKTEA